MTDPLDANTHKRLVLVKQLYERAVIQSSASHSVLSRILAVISFDLAVETSLRTVVNVLSSKPREDITFPKLVQWANDELGKAQLGSVPDQGNITHVHHIRNDAQHNARYPSEYETDDCRIYVRDFLRKLTNQVWGTDLARISLAALIDNQIARQFSKEAERNLRRGDHAEAVRYSNAALSWAISRVPRVILGDSFRWSWEPQYGSPRYSRKLMHDVDNPHLRRVLEGLQDNTAESFQRVFEIIGSMRKELATEFQKLQDTLVYFTLGLDHADLLRFRRIAGPVTFHEDEKGEASFHIHGMKEDIGAGDAEFAFAYCIDAIIQIESRVGDLDAPFS